MLLYDCICTNVVVDVVVVFVEDEVAAPLCENCQNYNVDPWLVVDFINKSKSTVEEIDLIVFVSSLLSERYLRTTSQFSWMDETHRSLREGSPAKVDPPWLPLNKRVFSIARTLMAEIGSRDGKTSLSVSDRKRSSVRFIFVALETEMAIIWLSLSES